MTWRGERTRWASSACTRKGLRGVGSIVRPSGFYGCVNWGTPRRIDGQCLITGRASIWNQWRAVRWATARRSRIRVLRLVPAPRTALIVGASTRRLRLIQRRPDVIAHLALKDFDVNHKCFRHATKYPRHGPTLSSTKSTTSSLFTPRQLLPNCKSCMFTLQSLTPEVAFRT